VTGLWELPADWHWATMGEVAKVVGGSTPKTGEPSYWGRDIPWITPDDLSGFAGKYIERGRRNLTQAGYDSCSTQMVPAGTVLFSSRAPIGYVAIARGSVCTSQGFKSYVCGPSVLPDYVYWYLKRSTQLARSLASGTTFLELSAKGAARLPIPVPPLEDQLAIVRTIEQQDSRLDAAGGALIGCEARIGILRRSIVRMALTGRDGAWQAVSLPTVTTNHDGARVPVRKSDRLAGPYPYYGASGIIDSVDRYLFDGEYLLVAEDGANLLSRSTPIAFSASGKFWVNNHAHVLAAVPGVDLAFLELWLNSVDLAPYVTGTAQPKLTQASLNRVEVRLPPIQDQRRLVQEVARQMSIADAAGAAVAHAKTRSRNLEVATLRLAFMGQLAGMTGDAA
jgi:restriction endonuclease S subunit